ncbi:MAG: hypothetical protein KA191_14500 [Verrucomicrobia bacterium]|jgi:hypothetical protein|nr:hypothetical protein [Verrucomicrobiota bacterium]OQC65992.1 MAG: hypothetical protein BWX48_01986 [Verrucomicrobia bacterium ADurb.Bin006]MDI9379665.1 hypothetical protein [Verrucomicrobiota bacterium]NMD21815.1 hypothetical protein [Verrucomicrobiota bacterium]HNV00269.1 hypothetical protein [Verrucomicrobiota bacterium]
MAKSIALKLKVDDRTPDFEARFCRSPDDGLRKALDRSPHISSFLERKGFDCGFAGLRNIRAKA